MKIGVYITPDSLDFSRQFSVRNISSPRLEICRSFRPDAADCVAPILVSGPGVGEWPRCWWVAPVLVGGPGIGEWPLAKRERGRSHP